MKYKRFILLTTIILGIDLNSFKVMANQEEVNIKLANSPIVTRSFAFIDFVFGENSYVYKGDVRFLHFNGDKKINKKSKKYYLESLGGKPYKAYYIDNKYFLLLKPAFRSYQMKVVWMCVEKDQKKFNEIKLDTLPESVLMLKFEDPFYNKYYRICCISEFLDLGKRDEAIALLSKYLDQDPKFMNPWHSKWEGRTLYSDLIYKKVKSAKLAKLYPLAFKIMTNFTAESDPQDIQFVANTMLSVNKAKFLIDGQKFIVEFLKESGSNHDFRVDTLKQYFKSDGTYNEKFVAD